MIKKEKTEIWEKPFLFAKNTIMLIMEVTGSLMRANTDPTVLPTLMSCSFSYLM